MRHIVALAILALLISRALAISPAAHSTSGTIISISGTIVTVKTRTGMARVDITAADKANQVTLPLTVGKPITAIGNQNGGGVLLATAVSRAKPQNQFWPADR